MQDIKDPIFRSIVCLALCIITDPDMKNLIIMKWTLRYSHLISLPTLAFPHVFSRNEFCRWKTDSMWEGNAHFIALEGIYLSISGVVKGRLQLDNVKCCNHLALIMSNVFPKRSRESSPFSLIFCQLNDQWQECRFHLYPIDTYYREKGVLKKKEGRN